MSRKKDCFGSESYVCRTKDCPYMAECVQVVWEKKLRRIIDRKESAGASMASAAAAATPSTAVASPRIRSRDVLRGL